MNKKRSSEEEKNHLLRKIRKLEKKIINLPESDSEVNDELEEGQIEEDNECLQGEELPVDQECIEETTLEEDGLDVLGVAPAPAPKKQTLHKEVAERWSEILSKGLKKEEKETISKENLSFDNVTKMEAPKLNKEVAVALNENARKRDQIIEYRQRQISTALSCVGQALQMCLVDIQEQKLKIIKKMNEAGRLLCDSLFLDSKSRRNLVLSTINKDLKESLSETETAEFLFGDNLTDKIKTAKAVQKSGKDLKTPVDERKKTVAKRGDNTVTPNNRTLNWRGPPRTGQQRFQRPGGPTFKHLKKIEDRTAPKRPRK